MFKGNSHKIFKIKRGKLIIYFNPANYFHLSKKQTLMSYLILIRNKFRKVKKLHINRYRFLENNIETEKKILV